MKRINCPICNQNNSTLLFTMNDLVYEAESLFNIVQCKGCGLIYINPQPSLEELAPHYPKSYGAYGKEYSGIINIVVRVLDQLQIFLVKRLLGEGKKFILDIGCGDGKRLMPLTKIKDWKVRGIEPDADAANRGRKQGLAIYTGTLEELRFKDDSFDLIRMHHVFEHIAYPAKTLREIYRILKTSGNLIIELPNVATIEERIWGRFWCGYDVPRHLFAYSTKTLKKLLLDHGFEIKKTFYSIVPNNWVLSLWLFLKAKKVSPAIYNFFNINNFFMIALFAPIEIFQALLKQSGRIRIISGK